jgi:fructose-1,6-bisphosphatase I
MPYRRTTFSKFVIEDLRRKGSGHDPELAALLNDLQRAGKLIGAAVSRGALNTPASPGTVVTTSVVIEGEPPRKLAEEANLIMLSACEWGGQVCGILSSALAEPYEIPAQYPRGRYMLVFAPLDGAANLDVDLTVGTIFSVLRAPDGVTDPKPADFLQPGCKQVAAGYALFGPVSMMVITLGAGVHGFTLDRDAGAYTLTHPNMTIPERGCELAIDSALEPHWETPIRRFVQEYTARAESPAGANCTIRWIDSLVAEVHRILLRGGVFLHPRDTRNTKKPGHVHLLTEANPIAMIIEQAGGAASTGRVPVLEVQPESLHQHVPLILGTRGDVGRLQSYHLAYDRGEPMAFEAPLFKHRSLFRTA